MTNANLIFGKLKGEGLQQPIFSSLSTVKQTNKDLLHYVNAKALPRSMA